MAETRFERFARGEGGKWRKAGKRAEVRGSVRPGGPVRPRRWLAWKFRTYQ